MSLACVLMLIATGRLDREYDPLRLRFARWKSNAAKRWYAQGWLEIDAHQPRDDTKRQS